MSDRNGPAISRRAAAAISAAAAAGMLPEAAGARRAAAPSRRMLAHLGPVSVAPVPGQPKMVDVVAASDSRRAHLSPKSAEGGPTPVGFARLMQRLGKKGQLGRSEADAPVVMFAGRNRETGQEEAHTLRLLDGGVDRETGHLRLRMKAISRRDLTRDDGEACDGWCNPVDYTEGAAEAACDVLGSFGGE
ncbi:MAG: hypothetical protein ACKOWF_03625 [Chloroflexota bacterium]